MAVRKLANSWQFDFTPQGYGRQRKAGFKTKAEAREAERQRRTDLISGRKRILFADAYTQYMSAKPRRAKAATTGSAAGRISSLCSGIGSSRRSIPQRWTCSRPGCPPTLLRARSITGFRW